MKAALVPKLTEKDIQVEVKDGIDKPVRPNGKKVLLVKVFACSLAAGDKHMLSGRLTFVLKPASLPYIPGKDFCGEVVECDATSKFKVGVIVVAGKDFEAYGGMAEYALVKESNVCIKPSEVDTFSAASCVDSASTALLSVKCAKIKDGDRVLVLGGSGGVGSALVQLAKEFGASLVATTSTQEEMLKQFNVSVINYKNENWWEKTEYKDANKFDVIFDCVGGKEHYENCSSVLKNRGEGGRFVAVVGDEPLPVANTLFQLLGFASRMVGKNISTKFHSSKPQYLAVNSSFDLATVNSVLDYIAKGKLKIILDPVCPLPFTSDGVKTALEKITSGHAHGKVVVKISE
ncbi:hypothetical protein MP638_006540 [Amoeboaphelidium occidentale]|nr:hypothetical protein MP638_006540 [Amoeboaphelidium occidentale]